MYGQIATSLQDRNIFAGEGLTVERIDIAIFHLLSQRSGGLVPLHLPKGGVKICGAIGPCVGVAVVRIHVSQVRVVLGIGFRLVHLLTFSTRTVLRIRSSINHDG